MIRVDTHVLGLLDLVDGSEPEISVPSSAAEDKDEATATATASESTDVNTSVQPQFGSIAARDNEAEGRQPRSRQPTDYSMHTKTSDDGFALGACANNLAGVAAFERERPKAPAPPIKQATPPPPPPVVIAPPIVPPPLNFLQEDELVHKPEKTETEKKTQLEPAADIVEPSSETVQHVVCSVPSQISLWWNEADPPDQRSRACLPGGPNIYQCPGRKRYHPANRGVYPQSRLDSRRRRRPNAYIRHTPNIVRPNRTYPAHQRPGHRTAQRGYSINVKTIARATGNGHV